MTELFSLTDPSGVVLVASGNRLYVYDVVEDLVVHSVLWQISPPSWAVGIEVRMCIG